MRAALLATLLSACSGTGPLVEPSDAGRDAAPDAGPVDAPPPPVSTEGRLFIARAPGGALHVVRVEADGAISTWGPPVAEATPSVERVGRLLQSADARRVLIRDHASGKTHALRGDRWADVCPDLGAERCDARLPRHDLGAFVLVPAHDDPSGSTPPALVSYLGARLAPSDGLRAFHSPDGWSVVGGLGDLVTWWPDGTLTPLSSFDDELPSIALRERLFTGRRNDEQAWLRDPATGAREEVACPDGSPPREIMGSVSRYQRCGDAIFGFGDADFAPTGHRIDDARRETRIVHVERGAYTVAATGGWPLHDATLSIYAPDGTLLARESRTYADPDGGAPSYATVHVSALRAEPHRLIASVGFTHLVVGHDDLPVEEEHAILRWDGSGAHEWHRLRHDEEASDAPASRVWFPASAERAYWVTPDGRLVAFDLEARALVDVSAGFVFEPYVQDG